MTLARTGLAVSPCPMGSSSYLEMISNTYLLGLAIDRAEFVRILDRVREIRNDVMHFDTDGLDTEYRKELQSAKRLLTCISPEPAPRPA